VSLKVLVSAPYFQPVIEEFRGEFSRRGIELLLPKVSERLEEAELLELVPDVDGVLCGDDRLTRRVLEKARKLKVICKWGTGIDSIDAEACKDLGIKLRNTLDAFSIPVADSVLGYALCFARRIVDTDRAMKAGEWHKLPGRALSECVFGIVGVGNVGSQVARRAAAFRPRLLGCDLRAIDPELRKETGIEQVSLEELLKASDFVSINCDLNPTSHHLIKKETLDLMRPTAALINTARGPIVREPDLCAALASGKIGFAALDVFEVEPLPLDSPLRGMPNVLLAPHNSNSSPRAWARVHRNTLDQLFAELGTP
jgi:D-3-phosphoglycerate dehydrogenase / 2-oxoglutarate reductase